MAVNGTITIPSYYFENAIDKHIKLQLIVDEIEKPYIIFLPSVETEQFEIVGSLLNTGRIDSSVSDVRCTELIDVSYATSYVYSGRMASSRACICAYDEQGQFVKVILSGTSREVQDVHFEYDGSYKYIRAASGPIPTYQGELIVYYRQRR